MKDRWLGRGDSRLGEASKGRHVTAQEAYSAVMERREIIERYRHCILETGSAPPSIFAFARDLDISERDFYENFGSFEGLEARIWEDMVRETIDGVESGPEWAGFSAHQKLLTFYFAFCEKVLDNRSFFLVRFPRLQQGRPPASLSGMGAAFSEFAGRIIDEGLETGELASRGPLTNAYRMGFFGHFLSVIDFNLSDSSQGFERTDAYIEKSVRLAFDVVGTQALDSAFDLLRFLSGRSCDRT